MNKSRLEEKEITERYKKINAKASKSKSFSIGLIIIIILFISPVIVFFGFLYITIYSQKYNIIFNFYDYFLNFLIVFVFLALLLLLYIYIGVLMMAIITFQTYMRTKYIGYLYEGLIELQILISPIIAISMYIIFHNNFYTNFIFILILFEYKLIKKPLIYSSSSFFFLFSSKSINEESSDIIIKQSFYINEFNDGYSSRPIFTNISEFFNENTGKPQIKQKLEKFISFLSINGDLIGFDINDYHLKLYLRTTLFQKAEMFNLFLIYKKLKQIIKKEELTSITIDLNTIEMNFKLNKYDYSILGDITYHQLSERILNQFKTAIKKFLNEDYMGAYEQLNPANYNKKSYILTNRIRSLMIIGYIIGLAIYGPILFLISDSDSFIKQSPFGLSFIFWPLMIYVYLNTLVGANQGDINLILYLELNNLLIIFFSGLFVIIFSIIIFLFLYNREMNTKKRNLRTLKIIQ